MTDLTKIQFYVLKTLHSTSEYCSNYGHLERETGYDRATLKKTIKELREAGLVEYVRGLMNDDGEVCGSGFCQNYHRNQ